MSAHSTIRMLYSTVSGVVRESRIVLDIVNMGPICSVPAAVINIRCTRVNLEIVYERGVGIATPNLTRISLAIVHVEAALLVLAVDHALGSLDDRNVITIKTVLVTLLPERVSM